MSWAMDELEARAQAQLNGLHEFSEKLGSIAVRATSPDDLVTAEVDANGALTGLWLASGANELGATRLGEQIVATAAMAAQRAFAQRAAATDEFNEAFADLLASRPAT
ncbi:MULTISPECIES: YbaB/EbfC family nucleoid-associated protein [unclassified Gordonia (in: high G+C Gram-positive bacteria)]|uniref:YbaB/EbfC family nucleoid-associated protein n=1 Tax=unclassified Gordonia (in: high G+C Gram-positive bacteria) TaxID=2657482 RepID=UPI001F10091B|nr:YbaB/EbfC family nucleoid-associated protein [Gordonia sp. ABSL49_1]MCH5642225.1 YbaB/EbfC family nucleoid-associated protein [Gordonia sp. ABSL49_1]